VVRQGRGPPGGALLLYIGCDALLGGLLGVSKSVEREVLSVLSYRRFLLRVFMYFICTRAIL